MCAIPQPSLPITLDRQRAANIVSSRRFSVEPTIAVKASLRSGF
jgi:hypothetical protein